MMNRFPSSGGPFIFTSKSFGYDHGFVCAWFLGLAYISLIPQNATALAKIPVIAMTANAFEEDVRKAREAGMDAHVPKPIEIPNLMRTLEEVIGHGL